MKHPHPSRVEAGGPSRNGRAEAARVRRATALGAFCGGAAALLSASGAGCHLLVGFDDLPPASPFGACTNGGAPGAPPEAPIQLGLSFIESTTNNAPVGTGLNVRACSLAEPERFRCGAPLSEAANPDEFGNVNLTVSPWGLDAGPYLRIEQAGVYFPTSILTWPDLWKDVTLPPLLAVSEQVVAGVIQGTMYDRAQDIDGRGHLIVVVHDCLDRPLPNVNVEVTGDAVDDRTLRFTTQSITAFGVKQTQVTENDGIVVYLSLLPSDEIFFVDLLLRDNTTQEPIISRPIEVPIRRGEATMLVVAPSLAH